MGAAPHLLHFHISHYNEKVRWALDAKKVPHTREALMTGFHIPRARWLSGQNLVPILVLDGVPHVDSTHILEEIERRWPEPALFPSDPAERARAAEIEAYFDDEVAPELRRLFWGAYFEEPEACIRMVTHRFSGAQVSLFRGAFPVLRAVFARRMGVSAEPLAAARARLAQHLAWLEARIRPSGYLVGDRFGVADLAVASILTAILRPPEFPYPLPEPWPAGLVALRAEIAEHPASRWALDIYRRHRAASAEITPA